MAKKPKQKNIFSTVRITRLIFTAWLISFVLSFIITFLLKEIFPQLERLHIAITIIIFFGISTICGVTIFYFLTKRTNALTSQINDAISRIAEGDFSARLNFKKINADIDAVVDNFNKMAEELNALVILNNDFVSNFSHEFKTPIVSVKGYAELLYDSPNLTAEQKEYLKIIIEESNRLAMLSQSAMTLSKLDVRRVESQKEYFWLDEEISKCVLLFDNELTKKNIDLQIDFDKVRIIADKYLTKEIWINLLSNAIKFTPPNGAISISLFERGGYAFTTITDTGIGFEGENPIKLFEKNYQADTKEKTLGNGIGLAVTKRIVELHGGTIHAEDSSSGGAQFVVKLPTNN